MGGYGPNGVVCTASWVRDDFRVAVMGQRLRFS